MDIFLGTQELRTLLVGRFFQLEWCILENTKEDNDQELVH